MSRIYRSILALNILVPSFLFGGVAEIFRGRPDIGSLLLLITLLLALSGWMSLGIARKKGRAYPVRVISQSEHTDMAVAYIIIYLFPAVHPHPWLALLLLALASLIIEVGADPFPANPMFKVFGKRLATVDVEEEDGVRRRIVLIVPKDSMIISSHIRAIPLGGGVYLASERTGEAARVSRPEAVSWQRPVREESGAGRSRGGRA